jgi:hypothetical protein
VGAPHFSLSPVYAAGKTDGELKGSIVKFPNRSHLQDKAAIAIDRSVSQSQPELESAA